MKNRPIRKTRRRTEHTFTVVIEPCEEGGYFADCPSLPSCHVEADTVDAVLAEMRAVVAAYLDDLRAKRQAIPNDEVTVTSLRVAG